MTGARCASDGSSGVDVGRTLLIGCRVGHLVAERVKAHGRDRMISNLNGRVAAGAVLPGTPIEFTLTAINSKSKNYSQSSH